MKKIISLVLALITVFATLVFAGCATTNKEYAPYGKCLEKIKAPTGKTDTLTVAMSPDFAPMEFVYVSGAKSEVVGFDVLLANYLAKELGMNLEIKTLSFDAAQAAVQTGSANIGISGFSWTENRSENYEITDWYEAGENETEQVFITTKANAGKFKTVDDCKGLKIGYQGESLQQELVVSVFKDKVADRNSQFVPYVDLGTAVEALKTGKIDVLAVAKGNGDSIIANAPDAIAFSGFEFEVDDVFKNNVCLIAKGNTDLLNKVNAALAKAKSEGLYSQWYDACLVLAGSKSIDELGFDANGEKITEAAE